LTLSYLLIILICLILVGLTAFLFLRGYQRDLIFRRLEDRAVLASRLVSGFGQRRLDAEDVIIRLINEAVQGRDLPMGIYLLDLQGQVTAGSNDRLDGQRFEGLAVPPGEQASPQWPLRGVRRLAAGDQILYVAQPVWRLGQTGSREAAYVLLLTAPNRGGLAAVAELLPRLVWVGLVALVVSLIVAGLIAYSIAHPLERIAQAAEQISAGNYDQQLSISAPAEVARLATSFNTMAGRVKATLQSQRDLVANVSHELKTPLTSIQGFSQALLDGTAGDEEARVRSATIIHEEAGRMRRLVDELLDLARLEAGQVVLAREAVDVPDLLHDTADRLASAAGQAGISVEVQAPPSLPPVAGDPDRLGQVFGNLADNAIKHSAGAPGGGRVTLSAEQRAGMVICSVIDNGPGIPADDLPRVFERFYQVDKSRARSGLPDSSGQTRGAGLGLAIAQEIVQAHGGRIAVESVEGLGTRFAVYLPAQPQQAIGAGRPGLAT